MHGDDKDELIDLLQGAALAADNYDGDEGDEPELIDDDDGEED